MYPKLQIERMLTMNQIDNSIKTLFANENKRTKSVGGRGLAFTNQLTAVSEKTADEVLQKINELGDAIQEKVKQSIVDHDVMDKLIAELTDLDQIDVSWLAAADEEELDRMLKSQQSKRSRSKSKVMTVENYMTMLTAAIAENLLRKTAGKPKSAGGGIKRNQAGYSEEELQALADDQEQLKKAIRNVQSKKCIMKSKANFDENSDEYQKLLMVEEQLKNLRVNTNPAATAAIETTGKINEILASADSVDSMKAADAKELLKKIQEALLSK